MTDVTVPGNLGPGRPNPEQSAARNGRALELRLSGLTFQQIGDVLGITKSQAWQAVRSAMEEERERSSTVREEYRAIHMERLERIVRANWSRGVVGEEVWERSWQPSLDEEAAATREGRPASVEGGGMVARKVRRIHGPSADRLFRALEREAKLLGLDAPMRVAVTDETRDEVESLVSDLEAMLRQEAESQGVQSPPPREEP